MIAKADIIEGVVKGMAVLEIFDTERQRLNATLAAQRAGLTRAAARRHLLTLHHLGYLESDGSYFWLSSKVLGFSGSYFASSRLPRVMQPMLERLTAQTGGSFSAVARSGDSGVIVARSADLRTVRSSALPYGLHLGARLPMHATSAGKVLLAALPKDEFSAWLEEKTRDGRQLLRLTSRTITDPRALLALIEQIRREDYFFSIEEHELGVLGLAVPLRDMQGCTVAALNVIAPARIPVETIKREFLPLLWETAREARALL